LVFSFFKKDPKDNAGRGKDGSRSSSAGASSARPSTKPLVKPVGKPLGKPQQDGRGGAINSRFATTGNALPNRDLARSLAKETAAKIDAIENEMARDFMRPAANTGNPAAGSSPGVRVPTSSPRSAVVQKQPKPVAAAAVDDLDDDSLGDHTDAWRCSVDAIELTGAGAGSVVDETAILFANGQPIEAEETLRHGIDNGGVGSAPQQAWLMLLELVNQRGDRAAFDQLSMQYASHTGDSPPGWVDYGVGAPSGPAPVAAAAAAAGARDPAIAAAGPGIDLPPAVDASVVKALETLKNLAAQHAALYLDASAVRSIDLAGAELLLRVVNAFKRSSHELTILAGEQLLAALRNGVEPGRRDSSDASWMLLLEVLRLLDRHDDFEEAAIQYCITFEVSPPSWEQSPPNIKVGTAAVRPAGAVPAAAVAPPPPGPLDWRGVIDGEGEPHFTRLAQEARNGTRLLVDCRYLKRMGFTAASALLALVMKLQSGGVRVEFHHVNPLVTALLNLLGVSAVAAVQPRRS